MLFIIYKAYASDVNLPSYKSLLTSKDNPEESSTTKSCVADSQNEPTNNYPNTRCKKGCISSTWIHSTMSKEMEESEDTKISDSNRFSKNYPKPFICNKNLSTKQDSPMSENRENPKVVTDNEIKEHKEKSKKYLSEIIASFKNKSTEDKSDSKDINETSSKTKESIIITQPETSKSCVIDNKCSPDIVNKITMYMNLDNESESSSDSLSYLENNKIIKPLRIKCTNVYMRPCYLVDLNTNDTNCKEIRNIVGDSLKRFSGVAVLEDPKNDFKTKENEEDIIFQNKIFEDFDVGVSNVSSETESNINKTYSDSKNNLIDLETQINIKDVRQKLSKVEETDKIDDTNKENLLDDPKLRTRRNGVDYGVNVTLDQVSKRMSQIEKNMKTEEKENEVKKENGDISENFKKQNKKKIKKGKKKCTLI